MIFVALHWEVDETLVRLGLLLFGSMRGSPRFLVGFLAPIHFRGVGGWGGRGGLFTSMSDTRSGPFGGGFHHPDPRVTSPHSPVYVPGCLLFARLTIGVGYVKQAWGGGLAQGLGIGGGGGSYGVGDPDAVACVLSLSAITT